MDKLTTNQRSENMRAIRSTDTAPEMIVRRLVYSLGYRYRLYCKASPGRPDMTFRSRKKVIYIHGCFWHQHNGCADGRMPKSNREYWVQKFASNHLRDQRVQGAIQKMGWNYLVIWECETKEIETLAQRLISFLES